MSSRSLTLFAATLVPGLVACGSPCDEEGLAGAADAMQDRSDEGRQAAFEQLGKACPNLPYALGQSLVAGYSDVPPDFMSTVYATRFEDEGYESTRKRACSVDKDAWQAAVGADDRDAAVFEACNFERYGVLAEGELFAFNDFDAYVLYEWLRSNRNDTEVSRKLVRGLMAVTGSDTELLETCLTRHQACGPALAKAGLTLPQSTSTDWAREGVVVDLLPGSVRVGEASYGEHAVGEGFTNHVDGPLRDALAKLASDNDARAATEMVEWTHRVTLLADGHAPWRDVADVLFTANKAGYTEYQLAAVSKGEVVVLNPSPPRAWLEGAGPPRRSRPDRLELDVRLHNVQTTIGGQSGLFAPKADCDAEPMACVDSEGLNAWFAKTKEEHPDLSVVTFKVDPNVRLQTLVTLIDLARGEGCSMDYGMDEAPPECRFWLPIVDLRPGLHWNVDIRKKVKLDVGKVGPERPGTRTRLEAKRLEDLYAEKRTELAECFEHDPDFQRRSTTPKYMIMFAPGEGGRIDAHVWDGDSDDPFADWDLYSCVAATFSGEMPEELPRGNEFGARAEFHLTLPMQVDVVPRNAD